MAINNDKLWKQIIFTAPRVILLSYISLPPANATDHPTYESCLARCNDLCNLIATRNCLNAS
jgi:hypothetical protein